jgi:hypothetical protein
VAARKEIRLVRGDDLQVTTSPARAAALQFDGYVPEPEPAPESDPKPSKPAKP